MFFTQLFGISIETGSNSAVLALWESASLSWERKVKEIHKCFLLYLADGGMYKTKSKSFVSFLVHRMMSGLLQLFLWTLPAPSKLDLVLFFLKQDYSELHHVEVIVKASLRVDSTTKNTVLQNAETQVIHMWQYWTQEGDMIIYCMAVLKCWCQCSAWTSTTWALLCSPGETDGVPREACSPVWRSAMVDHRAVHPVRAAAVGPVGFPSVEGRTEGQGTGTHPAPANKNTHCTHLHFYGLNWQSLS